MIRTYTNYLNILKALVFGICFFFTQGGNAQCDAESQGIFTYCNSFHMGNPVDGYFVAFRVKSLLGDTLDVVDLTGQVPTNQGKRIDDINNDLEPDDYTIEPLMIEGGPLDSLEFWYFGPFDNGTPFDIVLVDPNGECDTVFIASGTYDCADNLPNTDPGACDDDVPLYFLDFSLTAFTIGGGQGGNENVDEVFLIMERSRENFCCDLQPSNQSCFQFIVRLGDDDIGLVIDDVGSGSTGGEIYADSLNAFMCTDTVMTTWPFQQAGGQSQETPLCLSGDTRDWVVLTCKSGGNSTSATIDAIAPPIAPPKATVEPCNVNLQVFDADTASWSSPDDPDLLNFVSCSPDSLLCEFFYNIPVFGEVTACEGDTFTYIVAAMPQSTECFPLDTILFDTTFVVVYPIFTVEIDTVCNATNDSLVLTANVLSPAAGCVYDFEWSNGDTTQSITVLPDGTTYLVKVTRGDLPSNAVDCVEAIDSIAAFPIINIDCSNVQDMSLSCKEDIPPSDVNLVTFTGCGGSPLVFLQESDNGGAGCINDTLFITRLYIIDFDGDTVLTTADRDTCAQLFTVVDDEAPILIQTTCPGDTTLDCTITDFSNLGMPEFNDNCTDSLLITITSRIDTLVGFDGSCTNDTVGLLMKTWFAADACMNIDSSCSMFIAVVDTTAPVITLCAADVTVECTASTDPADTGMSTATDACDPAPVVTFADVTTAGVCAQEYTIARTWTATDACGNTSICLQIITVDDRTPPVITMCAADVTVECTASTDPADTGMSTATDACDPVPVVTFADVTTAGVCAQEYTIARTWTATDACGNTSICLQIITVDDSTPPVITMCAADVTVECTDSTDPADTGMSTATDACDPAPVVTFADVTTAGVCAQEYTIARTWTATDACGNTSICLQIITVDDRTPPVITMCAADVTVECTASTDPADTGMSTATDACDPAPVVTFADVTTAGVCAQEYTIARTWTATDACGNTSICLQIITVDDSTPPIITMCAADVTVECTDSTDPADTGMSTATDACDPAPVVTFADVTTAGACAQEYTIARTWTATDACGNSSTCLQTITVDDSTPPVITLCAADITVECTDITDPSNTGSSTATDACDPAPVVTFADVTTAGACPQEYTIARTWTATDACGNSSTCLQTITVDDSTAPVITLCAADVTVECTDSTDPMNTGSSTATDACDPAPVVTFADVTTAGACAQEYTIARTWTATDACGNSSTCLQTITVDDSTAPVITLCAVDITVECTDITDPSNTGTSTATDACDPAPVVTFADVTTAGACAQEYTIARTWTATDACGNSSTCLQIITVGDSTPPVITLCAADVTVECTDSTDPSNTGTSTASDACDPAPVVTFADVTTAGACAQEYTIARTWTATDACGNSSTCLQTITVDDSTPPVITLCAADITVECTDITDPSNTGSSTATDACDPAPVVTFADVTTAGACAQEYTIARTWTATDACGNSSTCLQTITVDDSTPPVITLCAADITVECTDITDPSNTGSSTATDACDPAPVVTFADVTTAGACPQEYTIARTWTATDACGNSNTCLQTITVDDSTAPVITLCAADVTVECTDSTDPMNTGSSTATDACDPAPVVTFADVTTAGACAQEYTIARTWTATDACGNSSTCLQTITVDDSTPPVITLCAADITVECTDITDPSNTGTSTATDACDPAPVVTFADVTTAGACAQEYTIARTWTATDACGNSSTCLQTITVDDSTPPVITLCAADVTVECTDSTDPSNTGTSTASDACDPAPVVTFADVTTAGACAQEYTIARTWTATDACGNSSTCLQTISVDDSTAPMITLCAADVTVECTDSTDPADTGSLTATDACDPVPVVTFADVTTAGVCAQEYTIARTWTATDACGNASTCLQIITVDDSTPPVITMCPADVTLECTDNTDPADIGMAIATDNCDPAPVVTFSDVTMGVDCSAGVMRIWTATDACGNSSTCLQVLQIDDTTPPMITMCAADITVECTDSIDPADTGMSTATDNCDPAPAVTFADVTMAAACAQEYTIARTWTATDICGNSSTCLQTITVDDSTAPVITLCVADVTVECTDSTDPMNTGTSTATDACDPAPVVTFADVTTAGACAQEYTIARTWTATDACGNSSTCLQTITVDDSTAPVFTMCAADVTVECTDSTDPADTGTSTATDNCDPAPVVTSADVTMAGACAQEYTIARTWTATDACGNSSTCLQTITVDDSTPPVFTMCAADITVECTDSADPADTGISTATDNCDPAPVVTSADVTMAGACAQEYTIERTWTATDACGNSSTCLQTITVDDSTAPVFTICAADVTVECTDSTDPADTGTSTATDACDPAPVVTYADVTTAGACAQEYTIARTWTATDACGNSNTCLQTITVDDSTAPVFTMCAADITVECTDSTDPADTGVSTATDNCDPLPVVTSADVTMAGACAQEYTIERTWTATDACGNSSSCLQTITVDDSIAPVFTMCAADVTVECTDSTDPVDTGSSTATDACDPAPVVTYADVTTAGACAQEYTIARTWTATDACGNSSTCLQTIIVDDSIAPVFTICAADVTVECTDSTDPVDTGSSTATDACDPAPVVTYADVTTAGACAQEYTIARTWTATDACGNSSTCLQTITVDDSTAPVFTMCAADVTVECTDSTDPAVTGMSTATDNCDPAPVVTFADVTMAGACAQEYTIARTWTATDACGNSSNCLQTITVDDSTPPEFTMCAADVTLECTDSTDPVDTGMSTATDACDPAPIVTFADVTTAGECPQEYTIARTWTATDACDNSSTCVQTITVDDSTPPVFTMCAADVTVECTDSTDPADTGMSTATDNCDPAPVVTFADVTMAGACAQEYTIARTWTATDACGNSSNCLQTITVDDSTPPVFTMCAADITVECTDSTDPADTGISTATDNCDPDPVVTFADVTMAGACAQEYTIARTWTATDACGNSSNCLQTITVDDSTPPVFTMCAADVTVECTDSTDPVATGMSTATDNCDPAPVVAFADVTMAGACAQEYTIARTWTATDACGNSSTCLQTITIDDSTPPVFTMCAADVTVECTDSTDPADTGTSTATDNCDPAPVVTYADVTTAGACAQEYTIVRTWTATDACGNSSTCLQTITVDDSTPPVFTMCAADVTVECSDSTDPADTGTSTATDACDIAPDVTFEDVTMAGACPQEYTIARTWTATDACGNASTCLQTITVDDSTAPVITMCPADVTLECTDSTDPMETGMAVATDNCDPAPVVTFADITAGVDCSAGVQRVWTATDACGNSSTCIQVLQIDDTTPPDITLCAADVTVECTDSTDPADTGISSATDNCDPSPVVTFADVTMAGACAQEYTIARTWTATDICGNSSTCLQTITVDDSTPPVFTMCASNVTVECTDSTDPADTGMSTATDACDLAPEVTFADVTTEGACAQEYTIARTWTATDACGNSSTCLQTITVDDSTPPVFTMCAADITVECTDSTDPVDTGMSTATDACDLAPEVTFADVTTEGACAQEYTIARTWTATDDCGNSSTCLQTITVEDSTPPVFTMCAADITVECTDSTDPADTGMSTATDACDLAPDVTFADVTTEGACAQEYTIARTWTATDACGNSSTCLQTITVDDSTPPVFTMCAADITVECTDSTDPADTGMSTATDACDLAPDVTFADVTTEGACAQEYTIARTWTATDACGNSSTCLQTITVDDSTPLVFTMCAADITVECTDSTDPADTGMSTATDACDLAPDVTFADVTTEGACAQEYTIARTWTATDACGNSSTCLQTITVDDSTPPVFTMCAADITVECTDSTDPADTGMSTATDACDLAPDVSFADVTTEGACAQEYTIARTWTATDACGNLSTCQQTITVNDSTPPVFTMCAADITVECTDSTDPADTGMATATDACDLAPDVTFADVTTEGACAQEYSITRTWTATDACGNSTSCVQIISIQDTVAPEIVCLPTVEVTDFGQIPDDITSFVDFMAAGGSATDNCGLDSNSLVLIEEVLSGNCPDTLKRTYVIADLCGNQDTCCQFIIINDTIPPVLIASIAPPTPPGHTGGLSTQAAAASFDTAVCSAEEIPVFMSLQEWLDAGGTASDNNALDSMSFMLLSETSDGETCPELVTRLYTIADTCGNLDTCAIMILVNDTIPPMIECPADLTLECNVGYTPPTDLDEFLAIGGSVSDNCEIDSTSFMISGTSMGPCPILLTYTVSISDLCGNSDTCTYTVELIGSDTVDLSLIKELNGGQQNVQPGEDLTFTITVTNEGTLPMGSITITDYIPVGMVLNDGDWTPGTDGSTGQSASIELSTINGALGPMGLLEGEQVSVEITLQLLPDVVSGLFINVAEISTILDTNGMDVGDQEIDSDPDNDDTNDPEGEDDIDDAAFCLPPHPSIAGEGYVCPGELTTYVLTSPYNPANTYNWAIQGGGGAIIENTDSTITVQWADVPGGPYVVWLTETAGPGCSGEADLPVYIEGLTDLACNDHINLSLDSSCTFQVLSGIILEGEAEGNNTFEVILTDEDGNIIPNATLTGEHVGQLITVKVMSRCNEQSCWGTLTVEDKIPPVIECIDVDLTCGASTAPIDIDPLIGTLTASSTPGSQIGPDGGTVTEESYDLTAPADAQVTDVNITVDLTHTFSSDLDVFLVGPDGTSVELATDLCGATDDWTNLTFDDEASISVTAACNPNPPALTGSVQPEGSLADFNGLSASGTWTLMITDDAGGDQGILIGASIEVSYFVALPYVPVATDGCGDVELTYTEEEIGEDCTGFQILRTWTATDESGNTSTCLQTITIAPLELATLTFPANYEGECGGSTSPTITGYPTVNGVEIGEQSCNLFTGYWDEPLTDCGGGTKILRTWTVVDWCTSEVEEGLQVIKLTDSTPPVITCPENITVGTDFWYCYANVSLPGPTYSDACGSAVTWSATADAGVLAQVGNYYVLNEAPIGVTTVTYTATDECGNSASCTFTVTVEDDVPPVPSCDEHTIVSLTNDGPYGLTLVDASVFDDGSYDNCGPVTFRARRMTSCIGFDWTTGGAGIDDIPNGIINSRDRGTILRPKVPFACCDVAAGPIMVELEVTDASGNVNFCMVEVEVQDKLAPFITCPPNIIVSCDYWFDDDVVLNQFVPATEAGLGVFGTVLDAYDYNDDQSARQPIIIDDPGDNSASPINWGIDGWADDNCDVVVTVRTRITDDCSGEDLPADAPANAVRRIERTFRAVDGQGNTNNCQQIIYVVDFDPFDINDITWPRDIPSSGCNLDDCPMGELTPENLQGMGLSAACTVPRVNDDNCSLIGMTYTDTRFDFVEGACYKILREWSVIDWCQYDPSAPVGMTSGIWHHTQVIKVLDTNGPTFEDCPQGPVTLCVEDAGVELPANNQVFLGEGVGTSCSVHVSISHTVTETCSDIINYDVKIYPFDGSSFIYLQSPTTVSVENGQATLTASSKTAPLLSVRQDGLPYNSPWCGDYHRVLISAEDGCGNASTCEYLVRLEDCKKPTPVCINGLSTVVMPSNGEVTIWAKDYNASSYDDCTPSSDLLYSFSGDTYQPSMVYSCDNVPAFGAELSVEVWVADGGVDHNCNNQIEWSERNKDFCTTTIVITDNNDVCGNDGGMVSGEVQTHDSEEAISSTMIELTSPSGYNNTFMTDATGQYTFTNVPTADAYTIRPERNDDHMNGVSTLDLVRIQKHLLGTEPFTTPYQYIAADANNSESVSAIDLIEIRKLILGIYTEYPNNTSWRFVDKGFTFDNPQAPWPFGETIDIESLSGDIVSEDFMGMKIGDLNNTVQANATQIEIRGAREDVNAKAEAKRVERGGEVSVTITIPAHIVGFQWTLDLDGLNYRSIESADGKIGDGHVGIHRDQLTMSYVRTESEEDVVFTLNFTAEQSGQLSEMIIVTSDITEAEAYDASEEIYNIDIEFVNQDRAQEFALYQNEPNPFRGQTIIGFDLPEAMSATLNIFDELGQLVKEIKGDYSAGYNKILIDRKDLPATGVVYYHLQAGEFMASKKMIVTE